MASEGGAEDRRGSAGGRGVGGGGGGAGGTSAESAPATAAAAAAAAAAPAAPPTPRPTIPVAAPKPERGWGGMVAVGLDVGSGWTKVSALGRQAMFPSLYSCTYAPGSGDDDVLMRAGEKGAPKAVLRDAVGDDAAVMATGRFATLIRPVKHGVPHDGRGYSRLAAEAIRAVGIDDPENAVICAGVPYDARNDRERIKKLIVAAVKPAYCLVLPQAYGTLKACGRRSGTIVNIGHGTTEIMRAGPEGMYAVSIQKASEFVLQQLAQRQRRSGRDAYTNHEAILGDDPKMTARLVELLATHIADEVQQFGPLPPAPRPKADSGAGADAPAGSDKPRDGQAAQSPQAPSDGQPAGTKPGIAMSGQLSQHLLQPGGAPLPAEADILLSGGGSLLPGMAEALEKALGGAVSVAVVDRASYSNAIGLEITARERFPAAQKVMEARKSARAGRGGGGSSGGGGGGGTTNSAKSSRDSTSPSSPPPPPTENSGAGTGGSPANSASSGHRTP